MLNYMTETLVWVNLTLYTFVFMLYYFVDAFTLRTDITDNIHINTFWIFSIFVVFGVLGLDDLVSVLVNYILFSANLGILLLVYVYALNVEYDNRLELFNKGEY